MKISVKSRIYKPLVTCKSVQMDTSRVGRPMYAKVDRYILYIPMKTYILVMITSLHGFSCNASRWPNVELMLADRM